MVEKLLEMSRDVDRPAWLEIRHGEVSEQAGLLARYEAEAVEIVEAAVSTIPELLQTPGYARSVRASCGVTPERRKVLNGKRPPKLLAYLDEAALHRVIGSAKVMADQLRQLAVPAERAPVEVRVIPWGAGGHAALNGAFELLDFADGRPLVYLEQLGSGLFLDQRRCWSLRPRYRRAGLGRAHPCEVAAADRAPC
ncbi:DUF5753 domain-containing protein [Amycolatopsis tolypomycina]|uniref:DUF5753 domain-containing protein n=1 Tax=Amycolatopsis tolypomycina TaxID=208445 RepID=UPI001FC923D4|nr:DUF5753 domain-containing protein [Amycolatopsis tolypomycina]